RDGRAPLLGGADDGRIQLLGTQPIGDHRYLLSSAALIFGRDDLAAAAGRCWEETFWLMGPAAVERFPTRPESQAPRRSTAFPDGGFYVLRGRDAHVIVDCGDVGMRGRGGHGHNDILSFELFLNGFNVVTDCGAYLYTASREWRNRFRSTAFHNTVQVDGEELNRFLGPDALWQLQYDAQPVSPRFGTGERGDCFCGGHSGDTRLPSAVLPTRALFVSHERPRVLVRDRVDGSGRHTMAWRFHLDPAVTPVVDGRDVRLSSGERAVWLLPGDAAASWTAAIEDGWVSPSYGVKVETRVVVWRTEDAVPLQASFLFAEARLDDGER